MKEHWRLDKRIPIALLITIVLQVGAVLIWATQLDARVNQLEQYTMADSGLNEKFARLEERLDSVKQNLVGVRQQLDNITDKLIRGK